MRHNPLEGTVVLDTGDLVWPLRRYLAHPVSLRIEKGYLRAIEGGPDADLLDAYMRSWNDPEGYAVSHLGWGLDERAVWNALNLEPTTRGMDSRSFLGNFQFSTGPNTDAGGNVIAQNPASQAGLFATGNGIPPTTGVNVVYNDSVGGAKLDLLSTSASTGLSDFALDGALCQRALVTGIDPVTNQALSGDMLAKSLRVQQGIAEVQLSGNLRKKPTIIVAGRSDALLPVNHASRAYFGKLQMSGGGSTVRYIEVTNANHFDTFIDHALLPGYDTRLVPLHYYQNQALDSMWASLNSGAALPASQVVRTVPRGGVAGAAPAITLANVPAIAATPAAADAITFAGSTLTIPD